MKTIVAFLVASLACAPQGVSATFHAALGLAQLGDTAGFEWLITHSADTLPTVFNAWPDRVSSSSLNLATCCTAALQRLSGNRDMTTQPEWETWWTQTDKTTLPKGPVNLVDP